MKKILSLMLLSLLLFSCHPFQQMVTLRWYMIGPEQKDLPLVLEEANRYLKNKLHVRLEIISFDWGDYDREMNLINNSNQPYDLVFTSNWTNNYSINVSKGQFLPLDELIVEYAPQLMSLYPKPLMDGARINGHTYAIASGPYVASEEILRINKPLMDRYGIGYKAVRSLNDLEPVLAQVKQKAPQEVIPFSLYSENFPVLNSLIYVLDGRVPGAVDVSNPSVVISQFDHPDFINYLKTIRSFYQKGYIDPLADQSVGQTETRVKEGTWAVSFATYTPLAEFVWSHDAGYTVDVQSIMKPSITTNTLITALTAVSARTKHPRQSIEFLKLLNTDAYLRNLLGYGIEDLHYRKTGVNRIERLERSKDYLMPAFALGNTAICYLAGDEPDDKYEQYQRWNDQALISPIMGFIFNPEPVSAELNAIYRICHEWTPVLFTGSADIDSTLTNIKAELKGAGLDRLLAEMQRQLDQWWQDQ